MDENINESRPKKSAMISARFTPEEHETIKDNAKKSGVKISKYARLMILTGKVVQRFTREDADTLRKLSGEANNLNQLARQANAGGYSKAAFEMAALRNRIINIINQLSDDWKNSKRTRV